MPSVLNRIKFWQKSAAAHQEEQQENPFSNTEETTCSDQRPKRGDPDYGRAKRGSFTEKRSQQAQEWVNKEIDKLAEVIKQMGAEDANGQIRVKFGPLFIAYQDISDTLVGILQRAKKRGYIDYPGEILFQGSHNSVDIVLLKTEGAETESTCNRKLSRNSCVWAESIMAGTTGVCEDRLVMNGQDQGQDDIFGEIGGLRKSSQADLGERLSYVGEALQLEEEDVDVEGTPLRLSAAAA